MNPAPAIPTIDVAEAERRLREDPDGPILLDVREANEFEEVRAPGAVLMPMSAFAARAGELPSDRPLMVVCHLGGRSAAAAGFLIRSGRDGRRQRRRRHGRLGTCRSAGPPRRAGTGRGRPPGLIAARLGSGAAEHPPHDAARLLLVGERPAEDQQDHETDRPGAGRVQVAELLADLTVDLEPRHRRAHQAQLEERALRRGVRPEARPRPDPRRARHR